MAPVSALERVRFECARCGGTIDRSPRPRTCPHCQAKKADRCQLCDRAVYIGAVHCPEHAAAVFPSSRTTAMPLASPDAPAPVAAAPRWVATVARVAIAASILTPAGLVVRSQTSLRDADSFDDLRRMMITEAPSPYQLVADAESGRGPLDVERIVAEDIEGAAARQFLTDAGLVRGYGHLFRDPARPADTVSVELYQYAAADGARRDMERADRVVPRLAAANQLSWQPFGIDTVPGAKGYSLVGPDGAASMQVVTFARGPYVVAVAVTSADQDAAREAAVSMAEHQRAKLSKVERVEQLVVDTFRLIRD